MKTTGTKHKRGKKADTFAAKAELTRFFDAKNVDHSALIAEMIVEHRDAVHSVLRSKGL